MKTLLIAVSALALATPALAQMETGSTTPSTTQPAPTQPSASPAQPSPATPAGATVEADAAATATTTAAAPTDPKTLIATEFPTYDKDSNGNLNRSEFAAWMTALKAKTGEKPMAAAEMTKWTDGAFGTADKDKSKTLTLVEVQTYLTAGA